MEAADPCKRSWGRSPSIFSLRSFHVAIVFKGEGCEMCAVAISRNFLYASRLDILRLEDYQRPASAEQLLCLSNISRRPQVI